MARSNLGAALSQLENKDHVVDNGGGNHGMKGEAEAHLAKALELRTATAATAAVTAATTSSLSSSGEGKTLSVSPVSSPSSKEALAAFARTAINQACLKISTTADDDDDSNDAEAAALFLQAVSAARRSGDNEAEAFALLNLSNLGAATAAATAAADTAAAATVATLAADTTTAAAAAAAAAADIADIAAGARDEENIQVATPGKGSAKEEGKDFEKPAPFQSSGMAVAKELFLKVKKFAIGLSPSEGRQQRRRLRALLLMRGRSANYECPICLEDIDDGGDVGDGGSDGPLDGDDGAETRSSVEGAAQPPVRVLKCLHMLHLECHMKMNRGVCPLCNT
jgi:hypothetical protein